MSGETQHRVLHQLRTYLEKESYKGYDPYDTLTSPLPFHWLGKWGPVIAIQVQKRNPINIRPLLGIKKATNPKAIGLLLHGYSIMAQREGEQWKSTADELFNWLLENPSEGYQGISWGYPFDWASPVKYLKAYEPNIVATAFAARGIQAYYELTKDERAKDCLLKICTFIENHLEKTETEKGLAISYTPIARDCCYNASLLAAEVLAMGWQLSREGSYASQAQGALDLVVNRQFEDGHWNYSQDLKSGKERVQIDFHQGYVLESIHYITTALDLKDAKYTQAIDQGLDYYRTVQFTDEGRSMWRIPKEWPVDIHQQAQGILTFARLSHYREDYLEFAHKVANWTLEHMWSKKGYFYFRKGPGWTNKIAYMRWGQAWMFLALNELLSTQKRA